MKIFFVQFFCVFLQLLLIYSASVRSIPFLSFIVPIFGISNFLEEISSLSHSIVFLYFFALFTEEGFLIFSFLLCFSLLFFSQLLKGLLRQPFCLFVLLFLGDGLDPCLLYNVLNLFPKFIRHSIRSNPLNLSLPLYNRKGFNLGHI